MRSSARSFPSLLILATSLLSAGWVSQQTVLAQTPGVTLGTISATPGSEVSLPVSFSAGEPSISVLQYDLVFPSSISYVTASAGPAAVEAAKSVSGNPGSSSVRILVFGLNQNTLSSGRIADVRFRIVAGTPPGPLTIGVQNIVASDPVGEGVQPVLGNNGLIQVSGSDPSTPAISAVRSSNVTHQRAVIRWSTNVTADSQIEFGPTLEYGAFSPRTAELTTSHLLILDGLSAKTSYHFRVVSRAENGSVASSSDFSFTTATDPAQEIESVRSFFLPRLFADDTSGSVAEPDSSAGSIREYIGVAVANLTNEVADLKFTAYEADGGVLEGSNVSNPVTRALQPGEQLPIVDFELFGDGLEDAVPIAWIQITTSVEEVAGFFLMFNGNLTVLDGANMISNPITSFVFSELENQGFTRIDVANPNPDPATLAIDLVRADGTVRNSASFSVNPSGALIADVFADIFPSVEAEASDYLRVSSDRAVLPFQLLGKASQYLEGLNGQDRAGGATRLYCPQYVVGGPWRSTISVVNLTDDTGSVTFRLIGDDGVQIGASRVVPISPAGKIYIEDQEFFALGDGGIIQGYLEISGTMRLSGSVIFGDPARSAFSASLPLVSRLHRSVMFSQVASNDTYFTGIAILNPNSEEAIVTLDLFGSDGTIVATKTDVIPAHARWARVLTQYFPGLEGQNQSSGYIRLTVDREIASFALFGTHDLSVLSAVPPQEIQ